MEYQFLVDTYTTERLKVLGTWSMFTDDDLYARPVPGDHRGRCLLEHMVHQCVGENAWFTNMLGIDVGAPPLPTRETRLAFIERYATDSAPRATALATRTDRAWWQEPVDFFDVKRARAWILTRRVAHTAHHRGQLSTLLRILGRPLHSTYGPTADTGGLPPTSPAVIYPYPTVEALLEGEKAGGARATLPRPPEHPVTERPETTQMSSRSMTGRPLRGTHAPN